jgi:GDYXXLXY protein
MTPLVRKGLVLALVHVLIVCSLGAKLFVDRARRPRVWARTAPVDPDSPLRGRYVRLRVESSDPESLSPSPDSGYVMLGERDGLLVLLPSPEDTGLTASVTSVQRRRAVVLDQPLAYFIPEHVPDPSIREPGEELWVEVTLPRRGAPRPIRLGVKRDGVLTPLDLD